MGQGKSCEAPEDAQKGIEDLALAGLLWLRSPWPWSPGAAADEATT